MQRIVEIGSLCERVEIVDTPCGEHIGRLRRVCGENVAIDEGTLTTLMQRAATARGDSAGDVRVERGRAWLLA